jgi:Transposase DDE domain
VDTRHPDSVERLFAPLFWSMYGTLGTGCHQNSGLPQSPDQTAQVFKAIAARGKTSVDWFFGFKLHLVCNDQGELLNIAVTPGIRMTVSQC